MNNVRITLSATDAGTERLTSHQRKKRPAEVEQAMEFGRAFFRCLESLRSGISYLAYAQEIAAAMLQRQQAGAVVAARALIVDAAVGMVEHALDELDKRKVVELDPERKAAMVSNLLVVLCGDRAAQPVVNAGSLYG